MSNSLEQLNWNRIPEDWSHISEEDVPESEKPVIIRFQWAYGEDILGVAVGKMGAETPDGEMYYRFYDLMNDASYPATNIDWIDVEVVEDQDVPELEDILDFVGSRQFEDELEKLKSKLDFNEETQ